MTIKGLDANTFDTTVQTSRSYLENLSKTDLTGRFSGTGATSFNSWKNEFITWLSDLFAQYDKNLNYDVPSYNIISEEEWFGCKRIDLVYKNPEYNLNVPATILEPPADKNNGAAVLCQHGHGDWGRLSVIEDPKVPADTMELADFKYNFGLPLAQSGYTVIAIDLFGFGERTEPRKELKSSTGRDPCDMLGLFMMLYGRNYVVQQVSDIRFALSILSSWKGVDSERLGMAGISQGGRMTMFSAALDNRIKTVVAAGSCNTFADRTAKLAGLCGAQIIPGIMPRADTFDIFASIAPTPLQLQLGSEDPVVEPKAAEIGITQVKRCYKEAGASEKFFVERFEGGHEFRLEPARKWFDRWLMT